MYKRSGTFTIILLFNFLTFHGYGKESVVYLQNSKLHLHKIDLQKEVGQSIQLPCDILLYKKETKWIEWKRKNDNTVLLVKYPNYQAYINPNFSTRFNIDKYGGLLINPILRQDAATYECRSFMSTDNITTFLHGSSIDFKIQVGGYDSKINRTTVKHVIIGHSVILTCKLKNISDTSKLLLGYTWTKNKVDVTVDQRFTVLMWGGLLIRRTKVEDAGMYKCTAKTLSDEDIPNVYRGAEIKIDVLYPPTIEFTKAALITSEGSDVQLPCSSRGNPSRITTKWLWNGKTVPKSSNFIILPNGTLYLRNVNKNMEGIYKCIPFNNVGLGSSAETTLKVEAQPLFTQVPPRRLNAKLGESLTIICKATVSRVTWRKVNATLPRFRTSSNAGRLHIRDLQLDDKGVYECKVSSFQKSLRRSVEVVVTSTPIPPVITNVEMLSKSAVISWQKGYDGGSRQTLEIWYRLSISDDRHWKTIKNIPADLTTYTVYDIEPQQSYLFSMRGVNKMGSGIFSRIFRVDKIRTHYYHHDNNKENMKPLPPSNVSCTRTSVGYQILWSYIQIPGRPQPQYFLIEYRRLNSSLKWKSLEVLIGWDRRQWSISDIVNPNILYEFRMFSFSGQFSEPSNVAKITVIDSSLSYKTLEGNQDTIIIVCFVLIMVVILVISSYCYCYRVRRNRKNIASTGKKIDRNYKLSQPYSSTESTLSDSEFDSCDLHDVQFFPNVSSFVLESQENCKKTHLKKAVKQKCGHKFREDCQTCSAVRTITDKSNKHSSKDTLDQNFVPRNYDRYFSSRDDVHVSMVFNTGRLLPEFPELRDSYDQFCTTTSEHSSRDDLDGKLSNRGSTMSVLSELKSARGVRDPMYSSEESIHACKRRRKMISEEINGNENKHRWSMPEFNKLWQENYNHDSDCQYDLLLKKGGQSFSEQSTQTNKNSEESLRDVNTLHCSNMKKSKCAAKDRVILGESNSCPSLVSAEGNSSFRDDARDYDSSGFYDDSDASSTSSPLHSRTSVNTVKENPQWHGYKADMKDSGIYTNEDVESNASGSTEIVYASDSGYDVIANRARDSPEGEEDHFDDTDEKYVDNLRQPKRITEDSEGVYTTDGIYVDVLQTQQALDDGEKNRRCAELMQEFIVNRSFDSYTPSSSFYRTSAV